jgi:hypothetical protein
MALSVFVWAMIGIALWHFTVFVPDRFWGGIIGAFLAALAGALLSGDAGWIGGRDAGLGEQHAEAIWATPGSLLALLASYL